MDPLSSHSSYLLQQLQEQRIQGLLCDCMLVVKGVCFKAHKNVLAAFSSYFRSLFQNQKNDVFHLVIQDVGGIGQILDYMYTSHLEVNQDNVQALLNIAQCLQVPHVLSLCDSFLKPNLPTAVSGPAPEVSPFAPRADPECLLTPALQCGAVDTAQKPNTDQNRPQATPTASHGYKLRNFYSKQYFKQSAAMGANSTINPSPLVVVEEPFPQANPVLPLEITSNDPQPVPPPSSFTDEPPANQQVHPKKAVYLKKFNYPRSHTAAEDTDICGPPEARLDEEPARVPEPLPDISQPVEKETEPQGPPSPPPAVPEELPVASVVEVPPSAPQRQYSCNLCGKSFRHPSNLELHKRSHTGEKPFQCNVCGKNFSQAGNLQTHLRRHSGEKPYICEICGKRFAASGDVQRHIVIHTGERPHLCDICGRGFSNFSNLKEHKKTHTADKVFTCDQCGKSFNMQRKLLKHRTRHSGEKPYSCQTCGKSFAGSGDLRRHVRTHTGERPYTCDTCGKCFTRSAVLRRHRASHCGNGPETPAADESGGAETEETVFAQPPDTSKETEPYSTFLQEKPPPAHGDVPTSSHLNPSQPTTFSELRSIAPQRPNLHHEAFDYAEENGSAGEDGTSMMRPSLSTLDAHCGLGNRTNGATYRNNEGPFFSSVTLWGLAMKTLQNDNDMDQ